MLHCSMIKNYQLLEDKMFKIHQNIQENCLLIQHQIILRVLIVKWKQQKCRQQACNFL